jgi:uncharacterized protein (TIGR00106 family)
MIESVAGMISPAPIPPPPGRRSGGPVAQRLCQQQQAGEDHGVPATNEKSMPGDKESVTHGQEAPATLNAMIAAFSITPLGVGASVSSAVADAVRLVRDSGLPNETNAMFTNVEGEWDDVMALIRACVMKVAGTAPRVSVVIKIDHRPGVTDALRTKVEAVENQLLDG